MHFKHIEIDNATLSFRLVKRDLLPQESLVSEYRFDIFPHKVYSKDILTKQTKYLFGEKIMPFASENSTSKEMNPLLVPTLEEWDKMTRSEQQKVEDRVIEALDSQVEFMGETTSHFDVRIFSTLLLRRFYKEQGKQAFIASDLYTLYPGEEAFYPDLLVVFDAPDHHRSSWIVANEKKGLDFALEVLSKKTRQNDQLKKLNLYARLEIPEYFMFDPENFQLKGYQLSNGTYREISRDDKGVFSSQLQLYLKAEGSQLRFAYREGVEIPFADEIVTQLNDKLAKKDALLQDIAQEIDAEKERAEQAEERAEQAEERAEQAEAEIERLKALLKENGSK